MLEFVAVVLCACKSVLGMKFKDLWKGINDKSGNILIFIKAQKRPVNCWGNISEMQKKNLHYYLGTKLLHCR